MSLIEMALKELGYKNPVQLTTPDGETLDAWNFSHTEEKIGTLECDLGLEEDPDGDPEMCFVAKLPFFFAKQEFEWMLSVIMFSGECIGKLYTQESDEGFNEIYWVYTQSLLCGTEYVPLETVQLVISKLIGFCCRDVLWNISFFAQVGDSDVSEKDLSLALNEYKGVHGNA